MILETLEALPTYKKKKKEEEEERKKERKKEKERKKVRKVPRLWTFVDQ